VSASDFVHLHRVTYADCTLGNHIYYARYLDLLEAARGAFFRHLGPSMLRWQESGTLFPVVECHLKYREPARYDDLLHITVRPTLARGVRLNFSSRVQKEDGAVVLEAETLHACTGLDEKPKRLPADLLNLLQPYLGNQDEHSALRRP
jgi:acyl-CoA thioester hydrolase